MWIERISHDYLMMKGRLNDRPHGLVESSIVDLFFMNSHIVTSRIISLSRDQRNHYLTIGVSLCWFFGDVHDKGKVCVLLLKEVDGLS